MDETLCGYIKRSIRGTCYKHKFYLIAFILKDFKIYIKVSTKDKQGFNIVIERIYPYKNIVNHLSAYRLELITAMRHQHQEMPTMKEYEEYVKQLKTELQDE